MKTRAQKIRIKPLVRGEWSVKRPATGEGAWNDTPYPGIVGTATRTSHAALRAKGKSRSRFAGGTLMMLAFAFAFAFMLGRMSSI